MKKLEREALLADRETVRKLLASIEAEDSIGRLSFQTRLADIEEQLERLDVQPETTGSVALMFGGAPVHGSHSIDVAFASEVVSTFQDLVTKRIASEELGPLGQRGRIPLRTPTALSITELVRGSVGFLLEEKEQNAQLVDTSVKKAIDDVAQVITKSASENAEDFDQAVDTLDQRLLVSLRDFFTTLDESGATIRIVEDRLDTTLDSGAVRRARQRIDLTEIEERESDNIVGELLGLLPDARRFEMRLSDSGEIIRGRVAAPYAQRYLELIETPGEEIVGRKWRTKMQIREIRERNKAPRRLYLLLGLIKQLPA